MERFLLLLLILLSRTVMVAFLFPLVNCVKGITAKWQGDDSAFRQGRITLDPRVHFDLAGCLATMLIGYGWSKPVPMSPVRMNNYKRGVILVSLSGPVTYLLLAVIFRYIAELIAGCAGVDTIGVKLNVIGFIIMLFLRLSMISVCIGVFHLLPIPPMDGFNILQQLGGRKFNKWYYSRYDQIHKYSEIVLWAVILMPLLTGGLFDPLGALIRLVEKLVALTASWIPLVFER